MKRIALALIALLLLVGCSSKEFSSKNYAQVSGGDEVIFTYPDGKNYTKQDLFNNLKNFDYSSTILSEICKKIGTAEGLDMEQFANDAEEYINNFKENGAEYIITYYGGEKVMTDTFIATKIMEVFNERYVEENFDSLLAEDKPVKAQLASFDILEDAEKFIEMVNDGSSFEMAAAELGYGKEASPTVYVDSDELTLEVKDYLLNNSDNGLSPVLTTVKTTSDASGNSVETPVYYVLNIISRDINEFKEEYVTKASANIESDTILDYMFKKFDIRFYDQRTYEMMSKIYEALR